MTQGEILTEQNNPTRDSSFLSDSVNSRVGVERQPDRISKMEELYRKLEPELRRAKPNPEAIAAALQAAQRLVTEADTADAVEAVAQELTSEANTEACPTCGYRNRAGNKFCGMCGSAALPHHDSDLEHFPPLEPEPASQFQFPGDPFGKEPRPMSPQSAPAPTRPAGAAETHHYHHHYHHHYFPAGYDGAGPRPGDSGRSEAPRGEKAGGHAPVRAELNRAEAGVRRVTQDWTRACNTKHLDDLLDLYVADAMVLRSNHPPVRGAAAVREFFFSALEGGLGEVELEPLRVEIAGDLAYEAGKCKALVPGTTGKRREERGKYLWVCARQSNGEWKLTADCWSSDLSLGILESDVPAIAGIKTSHAKKS